MIFRKCLLAAGLAVSEAFSVLRRDNPYAGQMLAVLGAEPMLANTADASLGGYAPKPAYRPLTKFENRGLKLGHGVWDLVFQRR